MDDNDKPGLDRLRDIYEQYTRDRFDKDAIYAITGTQAAEVLFAVERRGNEVQQLRNLVFDAVASFETNDEWLDRARETIVREIGE